MNSTQNAINALRFLSIDAVNKANSGHPGLPMGAAAMAWTLWDKHLMFNPKDPAWPGRDRFVLSAGHGSMLLYSLLHLYGYDVTLDDLKAFRQLNSKTPGHPEYGHTPGVETTTGPLGQGISNAVGLAMGEKFMGETFNKPDAPLFNHYTYVLCSEGDLMEGVSAEACSLAGTLNLHKLICLFDRNHITIDGNTDIAFTEDIAQRYKAYGWNVLFVENGNDTDALDRSITAAKQNTQGPSLIIVETTIGYGSPHKAGTPGVHGSPLGKEEALLTRETLGWPYAPFEIPAEVYAACQESLVSKTKAYDSWKDMYLYYQQNHCQDYSLLQEHLSNSWTFDLCALDQEMAYKTKDATRNSFGKALNLLAQKASNILGGSADLNGSTKTYLAGEADYSPNHSGRNIFFGIREHAMGAIANGLALYGGLRAYCATFLVFCDYMRPTLRLAALMKIPTVFIFTHDSVGVGEDGPTHQPVEQISSLRLIPNLEVYRPADAREALHCACEAFSKKDQPSAVVLSRQDLPLITPEKIDISPGAYVLRRENGPVDLVFMGSGSEVQHLVEAAEELEKQNLAVRVVSVPNMDRFLAQSPQKKEEILSSCENRLSLEAGSTVFWKSLVGDRGITLGIDTFGLSAPIEDTMAHFHMNAEAVVNAAWKLCRR